MNSKKPHASNLRLGRVSESGRIYLITCATIQRQPVFSKWRCGRILVQVLRNEKSHAKTLAFVVMPDHLHWLMQLNDGSTLETIMRTVKSVSCFQINRLLRRSGSIWQRGYHDRALRKEDDIVSTARYIVANPLRASLVQHIGSYPLWDAIWL